jgi:CTP synthase
VHGGLANRVKVHVKWLDAELFEKLPDDELAAVLEPMHGILVPGGFGERGSEGKISSVRFARERNVPFFGICLGMQMACIEAARNTSGITAASTTEFGETDEPIVGLITEWMSESGLQKRSAEGDLGGTMRLGAFPAKLSGNSRVRGIYGTDMISERHRHRYEVNTAYHERLEQGGLVFSGMSPDGVLPEIVERPDHSWFVGVQYHPELKSKPFDPHPLFASFIEAAVAQSRLV